ncbi:DUF1648 domain-containing protein [Streptomyces sp. NPDC059063]|uniref:DUF1648 domain-containing protein n=1 Tax=unclassified Streptomyces TaxID=2593676 RepID=UPI0036C37B43
MNGAGTRWGPAGPWTVTALGGAGLTLLLGLPLAASGRLPDRLATHWSGGSGAPDDSMPLWAAALFPALIWAVTIVGVLVAGHRVRAWSPVLVLSVGVSLCGAQAAVVRANLDRADWHDARFATSWAIGVIVAALAAAALGVRLGGRAAAGAPVPAETPRMRVEPGERYVWLSRTSNPWVWALAAVTGAAAAIALVVTVAGLTAHPLWPVIAPLAVVSLTGFGCACVQATVTDKGLEVSFGPLGWPVRRWAPEAIESAHAETRTPAQVGGWGYRLSGLGTTVMLRAGECLVIRSKGRMFAVSVDDAERGAALLNSLKA